jgi:hypothetical protein
MKQSLFVASQPSAAGGTCSGQQKWSIVLNELFCAHGPVQSYAAGKAYF